MLSIIIPSYNEMDLIEDTTIELSKVLCTLTTTYELIFVDDGSRDHTWQQITAMSKSHSFVKGISFSRNFGKESAILAGLNIALTNYEPNERNACVVIDCDLQHPPKTIVEMYHLWESGYAVIQGSKSSRGKESKIHGFFARLFYKIISHYSDIDMQRASDFKLLDSSVMESIINLPERNPFFRALSSWVGFNTTTVEYEVQPRLKGVSKWSTTKLIKYAIDNITSFTAKPLQFITSIGGLFFILSIILGIRSLSQFICGQAIGGFTTVILLLLIIGSAMMISLGIIGHYIAKIYDEVKGRPRYIISKKANIKNGVQDI